MICKLPSLRFKEFTSNWAQVKLGDIGETLNGLTYSPDNIVEDGLLVLRSSNIQNCSIAFDDNVYVDLKVSPEYLSQEGDILICVRNGSRGLIGKSALIPKDIKYATHGAFMSVLRAKHSHFTFQLFQTQQFRKSVHRDLGATINSINGNNLIKYKFFIPTENEEIEKIARFLSSVDKRISLLKEKHALFQQYKKGVMQKLFKQEIRFKDHNGNAFPDWKLQAVGKYLVEYKARVPVDTDIPVLTSSRTGLYLQERKVVNDGEYGVVPKGYFTYRHMSDDLTFKFNINKTWDKGAVSKEYPVFKTVGMNSYYLEMCLNEGSDFKRFAIQQKVGGTRTRLYFKNLAKLKLNLPCLKEQDKIANFLITIDKKIDAVNKQIELTQTFKKGLLQQMFV